MSARHEFLIPFSFSPKGERTVAGEHKGRQAGTKPGFSNLGFIEFALCPGSNNRGPRKKVGRREEERPGNGQKVAKVEGQILRVLFVNMFLLERLTSPL